MRTLSSTFLAQPKRRLPIMRRRRTDFINSPYEGVEKLLPRSYSHDLQVVARNIKKTEGASAPAKKTAFDGMG